MIYDVEFSLDAAAELLRITEVVGSALLVLRAADQIRRHLENEPADKSEFLTEGLYYIDEQPPLTKHHPYHHHARLRYCGSETKTYDVVLGASGEAADAIRRQQIV